MIRRTFVACLLAALVPLAATAQQREGGTFEMRLSGRVVAIDYTNAVLLLRTPFGLRTVYVTPGTEIDVPGSDYGTVDDLRPGVFIEIDASAFGRRIVAQIIRIR
jgi:hypothetical protein